MVVNLVLEETALQRQMSQAESVLRDATLTE
jgi:hypothetical protein